MKMTFLGCQLVDGSLKSMAGTESDPIVAIARKVRDAGNWDGDLVSAGVVVSSERPLPIMRFRCSQAAVAQAPKKGRK